MTVNFATFRRATAPGADPARAAAALPIAVAIPAEERRVVNLVSAALALSVFSMKLTIGAANIESTFAIVLALMGWLLVTRQAKVSLPWATAYAALASAILISQILNPRPRQGGATAVIYLVALYLPFLLRVHIGRPAFDLFLKRFQLVCLAIAFMVFLGYAMQAARMKMLDMERLLSDPLIFKHYNYIQPIVWGARFMKPNGFFMLETSHTSQLLAMGLVIEIALFRRFLIVALLGSALLSTFGGTGLMIVALSAPVLLFYMTKRTLILGAAALPLALLVAGQIGLLGNIALRSGELTGAKTQSSGYSRFIQPYEVAGQAISSGPSGALFGMGAGNLPTVDGHEEYVVNPVSKVIAEYGLPIGLVWILWFHGNVLMRGIPLIVSLAPLLQYNFMNGSLLIPINIYYVFFLSGLFVLPRREEREQADRRLPVRAAFERMKWRG